MTMESDAKEAQVTHLIAAFPSSSRITDSQIDIYLEAVEPYSIKAVARAVRMFITGKVLDRNNAFVPAPAELGQQCHKAAEEISVEEFWQNTDFVTIDSPEWKGICEAREVGSMPSVRRSDGREGWYVLKEEIARHRPLIEKHREQAKLIEAGAADMRSRIANLPALKKAGA